MTPEDTSKVLALAASLDPRLKPPSPADAIVRAQAWSAAVSSRMPFDFAAQAVINHYARSTDSIMPAHLNEQWRTFRRDELDRIAIIDREGVPMPEEFKEQLQRIWGVDERQPSNQE